MNREPVDRYPSPEIATAAQSMHSYQENRKNHWNRMAVGRQPPWGKHYQDCLQRLYRFLIPSGLRVLELGCGSGNLLASLEPSFGVGVDFSVEMIRKASASHKNLHFVCSDVHNLSLDARFDFIILSDLINDLWNVQTVLEGIQKLATPRTRIILNVYNRIWEKSLALGEKCRLATPKLIQNWFAPPDIANLLYLADFEVIRQFGAILCPLPIPLIQSACNRFLAKIWPFRLFDLTIFFIARPGLNLHRKEEKPKVSVIVPARNEAGNIHSILKHVPEMGSGTELIFVEGHSKDATYEVIENAIQEFPERSSKLLRQEGSGKGDAVRLGFQNASGDILMVFDADLTVPPEDLVLFYRILVSGKGEFINGVRLVYPMEERAMRFFNLAGNKFFSLSFSWLLGQPVKDTLCGTKVLWKNDYHLIAKNRSYFGDFDPFGDFDLIFGASKLNLKIVDLPIRYRERTYGTTNIQRWRHGWLLLRMLLFAARRLKFT